MAILNATRGTIDADQYGDLGRVSFKRFARIASPLNNPLRNVLRHNPIMATRMTQQTRALRGAMRLSEVQEDSGLGKLNLKKLKKALNPMESIKRTQKVIKSKGFKKLAKGVAVAAAVYYGGGALLKAGKAGKLMKGAKMANGLSKFGKKHKRGIKNTAIVGATGAAIYAIGADGSNTSQPDSIISAGGAPFSTSTPAEYSGKTDNSNSADYSEGTGTRADKTSIYGGNKKTSKVSADYSDNGYDSETATGDDAQGASGNFGGSFDPKMLLIGGAIIGGLYFFMKKRG